MYIFKIKFLIYRRRNKFLSLVYMMNNYPLELRSVLENHSERRRTMLKTYVHINIIYCIYIYTSIYMRCHMEMAVAKNSTILREVAIYIGWMSETEIRVCFETVDRKSTYRVLLYASA